MIDFKEKTFSFFRKKYHLLCFKLKTCKKETLFLLMIFGLSFIVRYIGLNFGYPLLVHPDEEAIIEPVYSMTLNRTLNTQSFNRPDQILILVNWVYLNLISLIKFGENISAIFLLSRFFFYHRARILITLIGSLIPVVAYKIGKENRVDYSVPAALLFAFFPVYVLHSHFITPDIPVTLFTLIIIYFSIRYIRTLNVKYLYLATIFVSINTAEKYPGLISFGIVVFAILWVQIQSYKNQPGLIIKNSLLESLKFFGLFVLIFYILSPHIFTDYGNTILTLKREARTTHLGADGLGWIGNLQFYLENFLSYANIIIVLFFMIGIAALIKTNNFKILPVFYGLFYWVVLSKIALHWERWGLPMYTFPLLIAAYGVGFLWKSQKEKKRIRAFIATFLGVALAGSFLFSLSISINLSYTDTTVAALRYCQNKGIDENNSVYDGYTPFLPGYASVFDPEKINDSTQYILLSSRMYDRFYNEPERYAHQIERYETVTNNYSLVKSFSPTLPVSSSKFVSWVDDMIYFTQKRLGKELPERFNGYTILIYEIK